eukprot:CAMPEP_0198282038 /NCGR_PEP_ID=MMETSP1449-20131203/1905_1 /TAXON_ID=420275 /ORGANISM="Attheya septentrionalis, Strain CCMP2084" /LENGTH=820 /DNA_ID=CAMNT_0043978109 /DNA_START=649 /DNA_END=3111 /DNA_ORIENTATION=+
MMESRPMEPSISSAEVTPGMDTFANANYLSPRNRGRLPFKKRRLSTLEMPPITVSSHVDMIDMNLIGSERYDFRNDEKIAALALVAAASAPLTPVSPACEIQHQTAAICSPDVHYAVASAAYPQCVETSNWDTGMHQVCSAGPQSQMSVPQHLQKTSIEDEYQYHYQEQVEQEYQRSENPSGTGKIPRQRVHRPPLVTPLPGGCHGRTARNHSYCRRLPCYNDSQYCKLHYQQYVLGERAADVIRPSNTQTSLGLPAFAHLDTNDASEQIVVEGSGLQNGSFLGSSPSALPTGCSSSSKPSNSNGSQSVQHQDKRYTGAMHEVRCKATTTRGRPCAYISTNITKYCHLHADYDTNPPPRRGGCGSGSQSKKIDSKSGYTMEDYKESSKCEAQKPKKSKVAQSIDKIDAVEANIASSLTDSSRNASGSNTSGSESPAAPSPLTVITSSLEDLSCTSGTNVEESLNGHSGQPKKRPPKHEEILYKPYPLLSSLTSDHWSDKLVLISTGPFVNRKARVVKWGNGWVTVQIAGILHNRRAVELYLVADDMKEDSSTNILEQDGEENLAIEHSQLPLDSTSHSADTGSSNQQESVGGGNESSANCSIEKSQMDRNHESTPSLVPAVDKVETPELDITCSSGSEANTEKKKISHASENVEKSIISLDQEKGHDEKILEKKCEGFTPESSKIKGSRSNDSTEKDDDLPLVKKLELAQAGCRLHEFDLLFGTAALERSRREVHKPERYEDKAMIESKREKQNQRHGHDGNSSESESVSHGLSSPSRKRKSSDGGRFSSPKEQKRRHGAEDVIGKHFHSPVSSSSTPGR